MPFDAKLAVQTAVYDALNVPALTDLAPVWQHVPDNAEPPLVVIGEITLSPIGGKGIGLDQAELEITIVASPAGTDGVGREFLTPMMSQVRALIEDQPLAAAGAELSAPVFASDDDDLLDDGVTYVGTQRFTLFVQPSD